MAAILCYCLCILYRYGAGKKLCFLFLLFYACVPYNGNFAVTMWKDVLFSGFLLLFGLFVYQLLHLYSSGERLKKKPGLLILLLLSGLLVCLFRSNGLYLFLLTLSLSGTRSAAGMEAPASGAAPYGGACPVHQGARL